MALPLLLALGAQAVGTGLSALAASKANKRNKQAMDAAARRVNQFQINPLGNKLAQAYTESKLAEKDINQYQKQEAQDLLRAQADADYGISDYAPSGFAALGAQSANQGKMQDQLGRLNAKYAPMGLAAKQQTNQLAGEVDRYNYLEEQERKDKEQSLANIDLGRAQAEAANRNQMSQLAIGLGASMAGTLAGASKEDWSKLFGGGNVAKTTFTPSGLLPKVNADALYKNAMKPSYNVGGKMKTLNPLQQFSTKNLSGTDYTQGVNFSGSVPFNLSKQNSIVSLPEDEGYVQYGGNFVQRGNRFVDSNIFKKPMNMQNNFFATRYFNPNMYYKPKGKYDVQLPIGYEEFINDPNSR